MKAFSIAAILAAVLLGPLSFTSLARAEIQATPVVYSTGETQMQGYLAYDAAKTGKRPGILVVHEWWGHNDYARGRARMLAEMGYVALAVDMYGDGRQAQHPEEAGQFAKAVMGAADTARERFQAALDELKAHPATDPERIAAIGYCFGGGVVLHMARAGLDLKGVVSFHGSLAAATPVSSGTIKGRILVCHGADDPMVSQEELDAFRNEMTEADVDYTLIIYPGATHSFTNPQADQIAEKFKLPVAYNAEADQRSWAAMTQFFQEIF
ncbi:MAG: dienelactone hydrolase family protein [Desulfobacterales bacterium]